VVDAHVAFDDLGLDALFSDDTARTPRSPVAERVVSWFGTRDPVFRVASAPSPPAPSSTPSIEPGRPVWQHLLATVGAPPAIGVHRSSARESARARAATRGAAGVTDRRRGSSSIPVRAARPSAGPPAGFARACSPRWRRARA